MVSPLVRWMCSSTSWSEGGAGGTYRVKTLSGDRCCVQRDLVSQLPRKHGTEGTDRECDAEASSSHPSPSVRRHPLNLNTRPTPCRIAPAGSEPCLTGRGNLSKPTDIVNVRSSFFVGSNWKNLESDC